VLSARGAVHTVPRINAIGPPCACAANDMLLPVHVVFLQEDTLLLLSGDHHCCHNLSSSLPMCFQT